MALFVLFRRLILRPLGKEALRSCLTLFAVALGVAVVVAMELAGEAAAGSFQSSMESLTGDADWEITASGGIDERILGHLVSLAYPLRFVPRIEDYATILPRQGMPGADGRSQPAATVPLIGLDLVAHTGFDATVGSAPLEHIRGKAVWVGHGLGFRRGDAISLIVNDRTVSYRVAGVLDQPGQQGNVVVMDIAEAQRITRKNGRLDRIEVHAPDGGARWENIVRNALPEGVELRPFGARTQENRKMLAAFRWNLRVLSYIALVVAAFLIYNTIAVSVVRRRTEIGILRALGSTRLQVLSMFLAEALAFAFLGSALGIAMGRLLAGSLLGLLAATVDSLYVSSRPGEILLTQGAILQALVAGVGVSLAAALAPAREAALVPPVEAMQRGQRDYHARIHVRRDALAAALLALFSWLAARQDAVHGKPVFGYVACLLLIAAFALAVPLLITLSSRLLTRLARRLFGVEGLLASRGVAASLSRTSVLVGALSTAVAMMASVGIMVGSFRQTVDTWMENQLQADFYLRPAGAGGAGRHPVMAEELAARIERLPGVAAVDRFRVYDIHFRGWPAFLGAGDTRVAQRYGRYDFIEGGSHPDALERMRTGDSVVVSEPFATRHGVHRGDHIPLNVGGQRRLFQVVGVYRDYSSERGYIIMDRSTLLRYLPDPNSSSLAIYAVSGADLTALRRRLEQACAGGKVVIFSNRSLRSEALRIFDRTFAVTWALEAVAILVAVLGVAGALLALVIDRRREMGLLRFLGASGGQLRRLILLEAGILGLLANGIGTVLGWLLSLILIHVINRQSFGWSIQFHWPAALLLAALTGIYLATLAAAIYPARMAVRLNPIEVVHEE